MRNLKCRFGIQRSAMYFLIAFACFLPIVPCYGLGGREQRNIVQRNIEQDGLVFIGVSPRLDSREEAVKAALNDAARKLSFFYSVSGYSVSIDYIGETVLDIYIDSDYILHYDNDLEKYLEALEYDINTDIFENNNAVFVITRMKAGTPMPSFRGHSFSMPRPGWVDTPPSEIEGFITGIGFSGRLNSHRDTVVRSYERAVIAIIRNMEVHVQGEQQITLDNYSVFGFEASSFNETRARGTLENFYILESWTDPSSLQVWTLAIARRGF
jgi:hypothetical protein